MRGGFVVGARSVIAVLLMLAAALVAAPWPASAAIEPIAGQRLSGGDISWPNCPEGMGIPSRRTLGNPMPVATASFAVIGLTNGPGWTPNPCLADQLAWARASGVWLSAYAMTTFPTKTELTTYGGWGPWRADTTGRRLRNAGYQQGVANLAEMTSVGLRTPMIWVDVEPYPVRRWSRDVLANREVVRGAVRAYSDAGLRVGFYSYDNGWRAVVGQWRKPRYPTWVPVGPSRTWTTAAGACNRLSFSGGPVLLTQWVQANRDRDLTCEALTGRAEVAHPLTTLLGRVWTPGESGPDVVTLQRGLHMGAKDVTGTFDAWTRRVVLAFQRSRGWPQTGLPGDVELTALGAGTTIPGVPSSVVTFFTATPEPATSRHSSLVTRSRHAACRDRRTACRERSREGGAGRHAVGPGMLPDRPAGDPGPT